MKIWGLWYADGYGLPHREDLIEFKSKADAWDMMDSRFYGFENHVCFPLCGTQQLHVFHEMPSDLHSDWYPDEIFHITERIVNCSRRYNKRVEKV
jgi:hypothetical protein